MNQRQFVIFRGERNWCMTASKQLLTQQDQAKLLCFSDAETGWQTLPAKQAQQQLGQEFTAIVFDATIHFQVDAFAAILGTITAGGIVILWLPSLHQSSWLDRLLTIAEHYQQQYAGFACVKQGEALPERLPQLDCPSQHYYQTEEQQAAISAIHKVVTGHRRRPLVLSADRGRGKSAALGLAAAQLVLQGKQRILVTAPSIATVTTLFDHAMQCLPQATYHQGTIKLDTAEIAFVAVDRLLAEKPKADLLLVDEAAAIPVAMLINLVKYYSRIVFATTLHGYEGTGRGFSVRFQGYLEQITPNWRRHHLQHPIRWRDDDLLEQFSFDALLLNAQPVTDKKLFNIDLTDCEIEQITAKQLLADEQLLNEMFGLLVLAHYRTKPSDLKLLLDDEDINITVMRYQQQVVACAYAINEQIDDPQLARAIYNGTRRWQGQLLPQSLLAHCAVKSAAGLRYQRLIRIAVHPVLQRQGLGTQLISNWQLQAQKTGIDIIGCSFAISAQLLSFWSAMGFQPVRLGTHFDEVSGGHSVMMLQGLTLAGQDVVNSAWQRLAQQWSWLVAHQFNAVESDVIIAMSQLLPEQQFNADLDEIEAFANHSRSFDASRVSLSNWLSQQVRLAIYTQLTLEQQQLCVKVLLQQQDWHEIKLGYSGKKQILTALRQAIACLLQGCIDTSR